MKEELWSKEKQKAEEYAATMERNIKYDVLPIVKRIIKELPADFKNIRVADIASGPGFLSIELAKRLPDAIITAVDSSKYMLDIAARKAGEENVELNLVQSDIHDIKLQNEQFDVIISKYTAHEAETPKLFLKEIHRLLKPGGKLFLIDFNGDYPDWKLRLLWLVIMIKNGKKSAQGFWKSHKSGFSINTIVNICRDAGFTNISPGTYGFCFFLVCGKESPAA